MKALITFGGKIVDWDFDLLKELCLLLDSQLDGLDAAVSTHPDPDGWGLLESFDHMCGLGFAVCQQYIGSIASVVGISKRRALSGPPMHKCGHSVVALVNAAANHWKHSPEWREPYGTRAVRTLDILGSLDLHLEQEYLSSNALHHIVGPERARFEHLLPLLEKWRDELASAVRLQ